MKPLLTTRRYVKPDDVLSVDSTVLATMGSCTLIVRACGGAEIAVAATLAEVAPLLEW